MWDVSRLTISHPERVLWFSVQSLQGVGCFRGSVSCSDPGVWAQGSRMPGPAGWRGAALALLWTGISTPCVPSGSPGAGEYPPPLPCLHGHFLRWGRDPHALLWRSGHHTPLQSRRGGLLLAEKTTGLLLAE